MNHSLALFAGILTYPESPDENVEALVRLLGSTGDETVPLLNRFREYATSTARERIEELYTATFDLQPSCYPYVGYHLFGEEFRRGMFMARLREHYRLSGFDGGNELPDHLCVILRFLSTVETGEVERDLVTACLVPTLEKIVSILSGRDNPYLWVLEALLLKLRESSANFTSSSGEEK